MKQTNLALLLFTFFVSAQGFGGNVRVEEVEFASHGAALSGSIVFPANQPIHAAVVFIHGSGKQTRNIGLAERFAKDGSWADPPVPWTEEVEDRVTAAALLQRIRHCLNRLPDGQRQVIELRDIDGLSPDETCSVLGITEANQRVLLHRGRARLRGLLDAELREV